MSESSENNTETLVKVSKASVTADDRVTDVDGIPVVVDAHGQVKVARDIIDAINEARLMPVRRKGITEHNELMSFIEFVNRHKQEATTIWAGDCKFTAVFNDHPAGGDISAAGWGDHMTRYRCPLSPEWLAWNQKADTWLSQEQFAEWLEERMEDLAPGIKGNAPSPVELLEMARNLSIHTEGTFSKKIDPTTGQYSMVCKEEHTSDSTQIYRNFGAQLRIFDGGDQYRVEMKVKFRLDKGRPSFQFTVHRSAELVASAFGEMRETVAANTELPVFAGNR